MSEGQDGIKIHFRLEQDEDGYPPVSVESVWASRTDNEKRFAIDNIPFFSREATLGDIVEAAEDADGNHWFQLIVSRSQNSLVRATFFDKTVVDSTRRALELLGCSTEYMKSHNILAINVPGDVVLETVQRYLESEADKGVLDYEEPILRQ